MEHVIHNDFRTAFNMAKKQAIQALEKESKDTPTILINQDSLPAFWGSLAACLKTNAPLFIGNPCWRSNEWEQVFRQVTPDLILGHPINQPQPKQKSSLEGFDNTILIPTGGSSGRVRFAIHTRNTLKQSAEATLALRRNQPLSSYNALPPYHISGLMPLFRALHSAGQVYPVELKSLAAGFMPSALDGATLSLVPTQLLRLIQNPRAVDWLRQLSCIFIGGAPMSTALIDQARKLQLPLSLTYGLTETGSMVTALSPEAFLSGQTSSGVPLSHANIFIENDTVGIQANSLFEGYFPYRNHNNIFITQDEGFLDKRGHLHISGRKDDIVITGGKKVGLWEIQNHLEAMDCFNDVHVSSQPDQEWGFRIVVLYCQTHTPKALVDIKSELKHKLEAHKIPKQWILVDAIPRNAQGKIDSAQVDSLISNKKQDVLP